MRSIQNIEKTLKTIKSGKIVIGPAGQDTVTYVRTSVGRLQVWVNIETGEAVTTSQLSERLFSFAQRNLPKGYSPSVLCTTEFVTLDIYEVGSNEPINHKYPK